MDDELPCNIIHRNDHHEIVSELVFALSCFPSSSFPVVDFDIPDAGRAGEWQEVRDKVLAVLAGQGRALFHCRGGCGRSGMAVLRIMIEGGEDAEQALDRLREVRPCAVETEAQMRWAMGR